MKEEKYMDKMTGEVFAYREYIKKHMSIYDVEEGTYAYDSVRDQIVRDFEELEEIGSIVEYQDISNNNADIK